MEWSSLILLFGGLAIFLYGVKTMSEALQDVAGSRLKYFLARMTTNRFTGVLSGAVLTVLVQSSSASTVMLVGFVNAGLVTLIQAVGVVMGANIGTTVTAWMVSILGFSYNIINFALPSVLFGVALLFLGRQSLIGWGRVFIGFGFLFLGLDFVKSAIPDATRNPEAFTFLEQFTDLGFLSVVIFIFAGGILTVMVQSSSAATAITLTLAFSGYIPIEAAYAMILGENIGTTITANVAAFAGNVNTKKTAVAHTLFNIIGIVWVLILFYPFQAFIDFIVPGDPLTDKEVTRYHISAFHTIFNVLNTVFLIGFVPVIASISSRIIDTFIKPGKVEDKFKLLEAGSIYTGRLSILELDSFIKRVIEETYDVQPEIGKLLAKGYNSKTAHSVIEREQSLDRLRGQLMRYLARIQEQGISGYGGVNVIIMLERIRRLEEIGDQYARIADKLRVADRDEIELNKEQKEGLRSLYGHLEKHYHFIIQNIDDLNNPEILEISFRLRRNTQAEYKKLAGSVRKHKKKKKTKVLPTLITLDLAEYLYHTSHHLHGLLTVTDRVED